MFENDCYLGRQKRFKCRIRQAQKAAQRAAAAAASRLSAESGTIASRDLNRKLGDDVTFYRRSMPSSDDHRKLNSGVADRGVTSQNDVIGSRCLHRKLIDDVTSGDRTTPIVDRRRFNNSINDNGMRAGLSGSQNGVGGGHVTYGTSISAGSYQDLNATLPPSNDKVCPLPHYRYRQQTVRTLLPLIYRGGNRISDWGT